MTVSSRTGNVPWDEVASSLHLRNECLLYFNILLHSGIREDSTKNIHNKLSDIKDWNGRQKKIQWKYSTKETNNKKNDVPKSTEDKV
jgi:hypothetical protein